MFDYENLDYQNPTEWLQRTFVYDIMLSLVTTMSIIFCLIPILIRGEVSQEGNVTVITFTFFPLWSDKSHRKPMMIYLLLVVTILAISTKYI
jgi:hypothetical protein